MCVCASASHHLLMDEAMLNSFLVFESNFVLQFFCTKMEKYGFIILQSNLISCHAFLAKSRYIKEDSEL